jgi:predicted small secreted protein
MQQEQTQMSKIRAADAPDRSSLVWLYGVTAAFLLAMSVSACNTMEGAGEDVSAAGGAMSDTAEDVEDKMD